jgi:hypothetical protein
MTIPISVKRGRTDTTMAKHESGASFLEFTKLGTNPRRIGDRLEWAWNLRVIPQTCRRSIFNISMILFLKHDTFVE